MTDDRTRDVIWSALDEALDDERIKLPPRALVRLRHRLVELVEVDGWRLVRSTDDRQARHDLCALAERAEEDGYTIDRQPASPDDEVLEPRVW